MTILEALTALNTYPIPTNTIEKICIERALTSSDTFDIAVSQLDSFKLATADVYLFLYGAPDLREQEISIGIEERDNFLYLANLIYGEFEDPKYSGFNYGFVGEDLNV